MAEFIEFGPRPSSTTHNSKERSGWRDEWISRRHRDLYGRDCPALDLDFMLIEYDTAEPRALVEYKDEHAMFRIDHPSIVSLSKLGTRAEIPAFVCVYSKIHGKDWKITPLNLEATAFVKETTSMPEARWVEILYLCRGGHAPADVIEALNGGPDHGQGDAPMEGGKR